MKNPFLNEDFLKKLDNTNQKEKYVRITALTLQEYPVESIVGKVTSGSINIDGTSAIRRTCNLSLSVDKKDAIITDKYWAYKNKFKLEIGIKNTIDSNYPDIIWFKQGIYGITSFSKSHTMTNIDISISGKDKMCFLNGELGGKFTAETNIGEIENVDNKGTITPEKIVLYDIILDLVHDYGREDFGKIIINDLELIGHELLAYKGESPLYLIINSQNNTPLNIVNEKFKVYREGKTTSTKVSDLTDEDYTVFSIFLQKQEIKTKFKITQNGEAIYYVIKLDYNSAAGYHSVPLTYASDLIIKMGETVQSALEKIKNMLGNYEYFYDLDGRFVFQKNKNYIQTSLAPLESELYEPFMLKTKYSYVFDNYKLITSISETPTITDLRNDFSIEGEREMASGVKVYPRIRYAIDKKPVRYKNTSGTSYATDAQNDKYKVDWREVLYQMAKDYKKNAKKNKNFYNLVAENNPKLVDGRTGYEQYYEDIYGFWRDLYDPSPTKDKKDEYYPEGHEYQYWKKTVVESPQTINFWIEFLDTEGELKNVSVPQVGDRVEAISQSTITSVCPLNIPQIKYNFSDDTELEGTDTMSALTEIEVPKDYEKLFDIAAPGTSCFEKLNELIYKHVILPVSFTVQTIPIYYLEPNSRIKLSDKCECLLSKISYNLNTEATMSLTCSGIVKQFMREVVG